MYGWNGWHHCIINTYASWLPGDPRGFRTRDHREHVDGDYKNPPPAGKYDALHEHASESSDPRVVIPVKARPIALAAVLHALIDVHQIDTLVSSVGGLHCHVLSRFPEELLLRYDDPVRHYVGIAKERSAKALAKAGMLKPGRVWAKKGTIVPIKNRAHQVRVFNYIREHYKEGAAVWHLLMPRPELPEELGGKGE